MIRIFEKQGVYRILFTENEEDLGDVITYSNLSDGFWIARNYSVLLLKEYKYKLLGGWELGRFISDLGVRLLEFAETIND